MRRLQVAGFTSSQDENKEHARVANGPNYPPYHVRSGQRPVHLLLRLQFQTIRRSVVPLGHKNPARLLFLERESHSALISLYSEMTVMTRNNPWKFGHGPTFFSGIPILLADAEIVEAQ